MTEEASLYIIDANVFMEAARSFYSFDIAPSFWDSLVEYAGANKLISIDKVFQEIKQGKPDDPLLQWSLKYFIDYFDTTLTSSIIQSYADLVVWAESHDKYSQKAKDEFMEDDNADAWVIAYAKANNGIVITGELNRNITKRIPIPAVCDAFDIPCYDIFKMLNELGFSFK